MSSPYSDRSFTNSRDSLASANDIKNRLKQLTSSNQSDESYCSSINNEELPPVVDMRKKRNTLSQLGSQSVAKLQKKNISIHHLNSLAVNKSPSIPILNFK